MLKDKVARKEVSDLKETINLLLAREGLQKRKGEKRVYLARPGGRKKVSRG